MQTPQPEVSPLLDRLGRYAAERRPRLEAALRERLPMSGEPSHAGLERAITQAVFSGGKRWRPLLTFLAAEAVGGRWDAPTTLDVACAAEFLHVASIALDDLPAMDDARLRRNLPALHISFGEDTAILAAMALLLRAVELTACAGPYGRRAVETLAQGAGIAGMVGGQAADLAVQHDPRQLPAETRERLHDLRNQKTVALIELALVLGAIVASGSPEQVVRLKAFANCAGRAYQIVDDVLDMEGDTGALGKPTGLDASRARFTYAADFGAGPARARALELARAAEEALAVGFMEGEPKQLLAAFAHYAATRDR